MIDCVCSQYLTNTRIDLVISLHNFWRAVTGVASGDSERHRPTVWGYIFIKME